MNKEVMRPPNPTTGTAVRRARNAPPPSESATMLQVIANAAANPAVDIEKMKQLFEMQEKISAREAKAAFTSALARMQPHLPSIDRNGKITVHDKNNKDKIIQETAFAEWGDINEAIKPILGDFGFGLTFRIGEGAGGKVRVTAVLSHEQGHEVETFMDLMHDSTGSKNAVQAQGSSVTYGKRYTGCAILNITSRAKQDRDDDGQSAVAGPELITEEQVMCLRDLLEANGKDERRFLNAYGLKSLSEIWAENYEGAASAIKGRS